MATPTSSAHVTHDTNAVAELRFTETRGDLVVLSVPGTDYKLHLVPRSPITAAYGKRIRGEIHANALRMHPAYAGGQFIEPVYGEPRIVQGLVIGIDETQNRILMDMCAPVWVTLHERNNISEFNIGDLWNCYVESGTRFIAAANPGPS